MTVSRYGSPATRFHAIVAILVSSMMLITIPASSGGSPDGMASETEHSKGTLTGGVPIDFRGNFTKYFDYESMTDYLENLSERFPDIMYLRSLGQTYEGREIWCAKISDEARSRDDGDPGSEPNVLLVGAHHGNEWISYEVPLYILTFLLENYGAQGPNGTAATYLLDHREIYIVPMLNADGTQYSHDSGNRWRKNREPNYVGDFIPAGVDPPGVAPASYGVDINRNYGWMWHLAGGSNALNHRGSSYRGPPDNKDNDGDAIVQIDLRQGIIPIGPDEGVDEDPWDGIDNDGDGSVDEDPAGGFTSAETIAMKRLGDEIDFDTLISYHSYSELVLWPWGYTEEPTDDSELFSTFGGRMAEMNGYRAIQGYDLYMTSGEMTDWFYAAYGTLGFTFEIGRTHAIPGEDIISQAERNLDPTLFLIDCAENPYISYLRLNMSEVVEREVKSGVEVTLSLQDDGYPFPFDQDESQMFYRGYDGIWRAADADMDDSGNWTATVPKSMTGEGFDFYFDLVDSEGRRITEPSYAPYSYHSYGGKEEDIWDVYFGMDTLFIMIMTLSVIWGGFTFGVRKAMRAQKRRDLADGV